MSTSGKVSTNKAERFPLKGWQQDIIAEIEIHEDKRGSDQFQAHPDHVVNRMLGITVAMPRGHGHTTFANYIASKYETLLVYGRMDHYKRITGAYPVLPTSDTVSVYEIFHAMYKSSKPDGDLQEIREKIQSKKVIVVDNGLSVSEDVKNFIYDNATGLVIMLG